MSCASASATSRRCRLGVWVGGRGDVEDDQEDEDGVFGSEM
jgi:hypothetical protein